MLPLGASAVMLGFGFVIAFDTAPVDFRAAPWIVPVAQALVAIPFVVRIVAPTLARDRPATARGGRAARGLARARPQREIDVPIAGRAFAVAAGFAFAISLGEFGATVFLARPESPTLPVAIFRFLGRPGELNAGQAYALAVVLMVVVAASVFLVGATPRAPRGVVLMLRVEDVSVRFDDRGGACGRQPRGRRRGRSSPCSGRAARGRARSCASSPASSGRTRGASCSADAISRPCRRIAAGSGSCSRITRSSSIETSSGTSRSGSACAATRRRRSRRASSELLELVGLAGLERRSVATLSGGEQQRVALARALAPAPRVLLLDEPLGSLDRRLRDRLLDDLAELFDALSVTALYVTHDQAEAFALGDRVAVMRAGRIVQEGTPDELWARPADEDVARFLGLANVRDGTVIRPEAVTVSPTAGDGGNAVVSSAVRQGPLVRLTVELDRGETLVAAVADVEHARPGERVSVEVDERGIVRLSHAGSNDDSRASRAGTHSARSTFPTRAEFAVMLAVGGGPGCPIQRPQIE